MKKEDLQNNYLNTWCQAHELEIDILPCSTCGENLICDIPIEYPNNIFGLKCPPCHNCGNQNTPEKVKWTDPSMTSLLFEICPISEIQFSKNLKRKLSKVN